MRHCESMIGKRGVSRLRADLLKSGTDISYSCFAPKRLLHPLRQHMVLHTVTSRIQQPKGATADLGHFHREHSSRLKQLFAMELTRKEKIKITSQVKTKKRIANLCYRRGGAGRGQSA